MQRYFVGNNYSSFKAVMVNSGNWASVPADGFNKRVGYLEYNMFRSLKAVAFCSFFAFSGLSWGGDYGKASKTESSRQGDIVVRYIKEYGSPCLIVQTLDPAKNWSILGDKKFCSYGSKSLMTDVSYASFEKITFSSDGIHFKLSITPLALSDDELHVCAIPIKGAEIKNLECPDLKN